MMKLVSSCIVTMVLLLTACQVLSGEDTPAVLVDPDARTIAELKLIISRVLNDAPVTLAPDALESSSRLIIERKPHRTLQGNPATGRRMEPPDQFRLVRRNGQCVLIHEGSGERATLTRATCRPES